MSKVQVIQINGEEQQSFLKIIQERINIVTICILFVLLIEIIRILELSIVSGFSEQTTEYEDDITHTQRKNITDRNGVIIAANIPTASAYIYPKHFREESLERVLRYSSTPNDDFKKHYYKNKNFVWLKRHLSPKKQQEIHNLGLPGIYFIDDQKRIYPHNNLFSHVIGTVDIDNKGISGIESYIDKVADTVSKKQLQTSLDVNVQYSVKETLQESIDIHNAKGGNAVVMDVNSGEVISSVSLPDFNPNHITKISKKHFNQVSLGVYELGSIFKPLSVAIAFDTNNIKSTDYFDITKIIRFNKHIVKDYRGGKKRPLSVPEIVMYSSNIGIANIVQSFGIKIQKDYFQRLGLLDPITIEIPEIATSIYPSDCRWGELRSVTMGFGHGISVTPIHFIQAFSTLVNGGILHKSTLLRDNKNNYATRVFKKNTSLTMNKILYLTALKGTAKNANALEYIVGGKTGTAEIVTNGKYNKDLNRAVCVAAFPMHNPKYAIFVMIDEPKNNKVNFGFTTGGMIAAPVMRQIIEKIAPILDVQPTEQNSPTIEKALYINDKPVINKFLKQ